MGGDCFFVWNIEESVRLVGCEDLIFFVRKGSKRGGADRFISMKKRIKMLRIIPFVYLCIE